MVTDGEEEEDKGAEETWGSVLVCVWVLGVVSLFIERERGWQFGSCGATLRAIGWRRLWFRAPAVAC